VVVKGKYCLRTKNKERARKVAEEKIGELMPYAVEQKK
jgi:hypothetical protein